MSISEIHVTCHLTSGCVVVIAMQQALHAHHACRSPAGLGEHIWVLCCMGEEQQCSWRGTRWRVCSMDMSCVCLLSVMRVYVVLQIAKKACGNMSMARGCIPVADQHS